jgi:hypothetical protein
MRSVLVIHLQEVNIVVGTILIISMIARFMMSMMVMMIVMMMAPLFVMVMMALCMVAM